MSPQRLSLHEPYHYISTAFCTLVLREDVVRWSRSCRRKYSRRLPHQQVHDAPLVRVVEDLVPSAVARGLVRDVLVSVEAVVSLIPGEDDAVFMKAEPLSPLMTSQLARKNCPLFSQPLILYAYNAYPKCVT